MAAEEIKKIANLIDALDSDNFEERDAASKRLEALGGDIESVLQEALSRKPALEARLRLERLLKQARSAAASPELLRPHRAIQVLERHASPEARRLLAELADGAPEAARTQQARAALARRPDRR